MVFKMIVVASFGFCVYDKYINFMLGVWILLYSTIQLNPFQDFSFDSSSFSS